jgi:hypothetical protein
MKVLAFALCLLLIPTMAWTSTPGSSDLPIQPAEAIQLAAAAAPDGVPGTFAMRVRATGKKDGFVYLNSEPDYRDQRCLTIAIAPEAARELTARFGADPASALKDKDILVTGEATRTTVWFVERGKRTGKYYYQTHVAVTEPDQLQIASAAVPESTSQ